MCLRGALSSKNVDSLVGTQCEYDVDQPVSPVSFLERTKVAGSTELHAIAPREKSGPVIVSHD